MPMIYVVLPSSARMYDEPEGEVELDFEDVCDIVSQLNESELKTLAEFINKLLERIKTEEFEYTQFGGDEE